MGGEKLSCISLLGELLESPPQCGEKMGRFSCTNSVPGSPPRGRGKAHLWIIHQIFIRITPAWAGKRKPHLHKKGCTWDHPRMGGEKRLNDGDFENGKGSPPHGRGKVVQPPAGLRPAGITPARAGKSVPARCSVSAVEDHPRTGGEKFKSWRTVKPVSGSPPHGRGKVFHRAISFATSGITPAWAGKSTPREEKQAGNKDHPRMGGEKQVARADEMGGEGSPPHGRGKALGAPVSG